MKIHKAKLESMVNLLELPRSADFNHVGEQEGVPTVWYVFDNDDDKTKTAEFTVSVIATGSEFESNVGKFLGTIQMQSGLVWHIFADGPGL